MISFKSSIKKNAKVISERETKNFLFIATKCGLVSSDDILSAWKIENPSNSISYDDFVAHFEQLKEANKNT